MIAAGSRTRQAPADPARAPRSAIRDDREHRPCEGRVQHRAGRQGELALRTIRVGRAVELAQLVSRAALLAAAAFFAPATAHAKAERPALHWVRGTAADSCIDPYALAVRVQSITGPTLVSAAQADLSIEARIERRAPKVFTVSMQLTPAGGPTGSARVVSFHTEDCRSLDATIAFIIAMAIDPELGSEGIPSELSWVDEQDSWATVESLRRELAQQPTPPQVNARTPPTAAEPLRDRVSTPEPLERSESDAHESSVPAPRRWQFLAAAVGGNGRDSSAAAGVALSLAREFSAAFSAALQAIAVTGLTSRELTAGRSVMTQSFDFAVLACLETALATRLALRGCAGPQVTALVASGRGFLPDKSAALADVGGALRIDVRHAFDAHWSVTAAALASVGVTQPSVRYEQAKDEVEAFRAARFTVLGGLGVTYAF